MRLPDPPMYPVAELERRANALLAEHFGGDPPIPVDIDLLAERLDGVLLDYARALREDHGLDGMVLRDVDTGELLILIDEWLADHNPNRYRMTVAEEVAHIVLHRPLVDAIDSIETFRCLQRHAKAPEIERNAKRFAAALLMPGDAVTGAAREVYPKLVKTAGFGDVQAVLKFMATLLAKQFEVSTETMSYRLREWPMRIFERVEDAVKNGLSFLP